LVDDNFVQKNYDNFFDSEIVDVPPDFFTKNNYKRYVIFGASTNDLDFLKNSLYGIESDQGFFHVAVLEENSILDETSKELDTLKSEVQEFGSTLGNASKNIDTSVASVSNSVLNIEEASSQLNSLLFPIVASIGIIVALQVAILARRR
jgi:flagellin-like hook-associated protein FlgL